jgi:hypothetical protein
LVLGRDLHFERQSDAETREELSKFSPANVVEAFFSFFAAGEFDDSKVLATVQEITGRQSRTFEQSTRAHTGAFRCVWNKLIVAKPSFI